MKIKLNLSDVETSIKKLETYKKDLRNKQKILLMRLGEIGFNVTEVRFRQAIYDGTNDVVVQAPYWTEDDKLILSATGKVVTFIEFGTGIRYLQIHPKAAELGAVRGQYGKGKGKNQSWAYYGEAGTNGKIVREDAHGNVILTHGNPPAQAMYEATIEMRNKILDIAKEVFRSDRRGK